MRARQPFRYDGQVGQNRLLLKYLDHFLLQNNSSNFARSTDMIVFTLRKISKCIGSLFQSRIIHLSGHCLTSRDCGQAVVLIS
ncbi:hypothetical protein SAMN04488117_11842 [Celeribacter baekdonensis]|uniref:Uncharacterized protein n=1 Tax=Celeribacter baekdonensis TaxID=875171 RepID=A0A1G7TRA7_9RHOB|nr:hypothetical protein SAMN04488117_11842 [Celeribacter baekdonensis]